MVSRKWFGMWSHANAVSKNWLRYFSYLGSSAHSTFVRFWGFRVTLTEKRPETTNFEGSTAEFSVLGYDVVTCCTRFQYLCCYAYSYLQSFQSRAKKHTALWLLIFNATENHLSVSKSSNVPYHKEHDWCSQESSCYGIFLDGLPVANYYSENECTSTNTWSSPHVSFSCNVSSLDLRDGNRKPKHESGQWGAFQFRVYYGNTGNDWNPPRSVTV